MSPTRFALAASLLLLANLASCTSGLIADSNESVDPDASQPESDVDGSPSSPAADAEAPALEIDARQFDLSEPSYDFFRNKTLHGKTRALQSFAFDNVNHRLFTAQLQDGTSGDDLCISEISFTGALLGHMHLNGAGHGVSIGAEAVGTDSYLWVETDSHKTTDDGRGTALLRFKFEDGSTPTGEKFLTGSKTITSSTDPVHGRLAVRRNEGGKMHFSVYELADAAQGDFSAPVAHFPQPALSDSAVTFQGYTIYGDYIYTLDGRGHNDPADIDSYITTINIHTGKVVKRAITRAGKSLNYREPEGMAIYRTEAGETRLMFGFATRDGSKRYASIFYKNVLVD